MRNIFLAVLFLTAILVYIQEHTQLDQIKTKLDKVSVSVLPPKPKIHTIKPKPKPKPEPRICCPYVKPID